MNKKYKFTGETMSWCGRTARRIQALVDIPSKNVKAGDLGGWIENETNLDAIGAAWVADDAIVGDNARVFDNALVSGDARAYGNARLCHASVLTGHAFLCDCAALYGHAKVDGSSFVGDNAIVYGLASIGGHARVLGHARLKNKARVCGDVIICKHVILVDGLIQSNSDYICVGPIGSRSGSTTLNVSTGTVCTGCFEGTLDELEKAVKRTHGNNEHAQAYTKLIQYFRSIMTDRE